MATYAGLNQIKNVDVRKRTRNAKGHALLFWTRGRKGRNNVVTNIQRRTGRMQEPRKTITNTP